MRYGIGRPDVEKKWLFERCREIEETSNDCLDLWAREHYKSTIITYAKSVQDILASHGDNPLPEWNGQEVTIGIFSHTRPIAKGFLRQIKREFEANPRLKEWFPDIIWDNPKAESPKWSEDDGIILKRKTNPKEATVEAWGVVDGQPISKHFLGLVYDDIVTRESVNTPEQIQKTTEMLELSYNLGAEGGFRRFIGTRYHFNDSYKVILDRGTAKPRVYAATQDGTVDGEPVLLPVERLREKRRDMGPYTFACQMLQNPVADDAQGFQRAWIKHHAGVERKKLNVYMLIDAANSKRKTSDYTVIWVIGVGSDENAYVLELVRDRMNLTERTKKVIDLHRIWKPMKRHGVRYETYGLQGDVQHLKEQMKTLAYNFDITEVGGSTPKPDRIRRLIPWFEQGRMFFPESLHYTDYQRLTRDLVRDFVEEEYMAFPVSVHDDMLDSLARLVEPDYPVEFPNAPVAQQTQPVYSNLQPQGWMG